MAIAKESLGPTELAQLVNAAIQGRMALLEAQRNATEKQTTLRKLVEQDPPLGGLIDLRDEIEARVTSRPVPPPVIAHPNMLTAPFFRPAGEKKAPIVMPAEKVVALPPKHESRVTKRQYLDRLIEESQEKGLPFEVLRQRHRHLFAALDKKATSEGPKDPFRRQALEFLGAFGLFCLAVGTIPASIWVINQLSRGGTRVAKKAEPPQPYQLPKNEKRPTKVVEVEKNPTQVTANQLGQGNDTGGQQVDVPMKTRVSTVQTGLSEAELVVSEPTRIPARAGEFHQVGEEDTVWGLLDETIFRDREGSITQADIEAFCAINNIDIERSCPTIRFGHNVYIPTREELNDKKEALAKAAAKATVQAETKPTLTPTPSPVVENSAGQNNQAADNGEKPAEEVTSHQVTEITPPPDLSQNVLSTEEEIQGWLEARREMADAGTNSAGVNHFPLFLDRPVTVDVEPVTLKGEVQPSSWLSTYLPKWLQGEKAPLAQLLNYLPEDLRGLAEGLIGDDREEIDIQGMGFRNLPAGISLHPSLERIAAEQGFWFNYEEFWGLHSLMIDRWDLFYVVVFIPGEAPDQFKGEAFTPCQQFAEGVCEENVPEEVEKARLACAQEIAAICRDQVGERTFQAIVFSFRSVPTGKKTLRGGARYKMIFLPR